MEEANQTQADPEDAPDVRDNLEADKLPEDTASFRSQLTDCQAKVSEYLDGWQRSRAEFTNYKKRVERERLQEYQNAAGSIIKRYLDVLDDLERALNNRPAAGEGAEWATGVELVYRKLYSILEAEGVKPMDVNGQDFDPNLHEAVSHEDCDQVESGKVIAAVKQGYLLGDRVLRPAVVRVAK
jgi:molecular chaperone GrpE